MHIDSCSDRGASPRRAGESIVWRAGKARDEGTKATPCAIPIIILWVLRARTRHLKNLDPVEMSLFFISSTSSSSLIHHFSRKVMNENAFSFITYSVSIRSPPPPSLRAHILHHSPHTPSHILHRAHNTHAPPSRRLRRPPPMVPHVGRRERASTARPNLLHTHTHTHTHTCSWVRTRAGKGRGTGSYTLTNTHTRPHARGFHSVSLQRGNLPPCF